MSYPFAVRLTIPPTPWAALQDLYRDGLPLDASDAAVRGTLWVSGIDPSVPKGRHIIEFHRVTRYQYLTGHPF